MMTKSPLYTNSLRIYMIIDLPTLTVIKEHLNISHQYIHLIQKFQIIHVC
jgi:hypothetical protein